MRGNREERYIADEWISSYADLSQIQGPRWVTWDTHRTVWNTLYTESWIRKSKLLQRLLNYSHPQLAKLGKEYCKGENKSVCHTQKLIDFILSYIISLLNSKEYLRRSPEIFYKCPRGPVGETNNVHNTRSGLFLPDQFFRNTSKEMMSDTMCGYNWQSSRAIAVSQHTCW